MAFRKAERSQSKLRFGLTGPSGAGKTYTALMLATMLGKRVAVIDTERGSASKYAGEFSFDVEELSNYHPDHYIKAIKEAEAAGYDVLVIDSLSHAWAGEGGILEIVDKNSTTSTGKEDKFGSGWKKATPIQNQLVNRILQTRMHVICTMRMKTEWVLKEQGGKTKPQKVGQAPIQRSEVEYEFDVFASMDIENDLTVLKSRCKALHKKEFRVTSIPEVGTTLLEWLNEGAPAVEPPPDEDVPDPRPMSKTAAMKARLEEVQTWEAFTAAADAIKADFSEAEKADVRPAADRRMTYLKQKLGPPPKPATPAPDAATQALADAASGPSLLDKVLAAISEAPTADTLGATWPQVEALAVTEDREVALAKYNARKAALAKAAP